MVDLHAQAQLDLAQVLVERSAQAGEAGVVFRVEGEVAFVEAWGHASWLPLPSGERIEVRGRSCEKLWGMRPDWPLTPTLSPEGRGSKAQAAASVSACTRPRSELVMASVIST